MPSSIAAFATIAPIAPKPITPRVLPLISGPTNWLLPFSASSGISSPLSSSFTAFAFAPGVLKTTTPFSVIAGIGILFVPAPARATALTVAGNSIECMSAERRRIASGLLISEATSYSSRGNFSNPATEILFKV